MAQIPAVGRAGAAPIGAGDSGRAAAHPWLTLAAVVPGLMMVMLDASVVSVANATIGRDLHASLAGLEWVFNGYLLALATGLILGGKLGDLYGRRLLFTGGVTVFALASLGCGLSGSVGVLIFFRVMQGLGGALMLPQTLATLRASFPARRLQLAIGVWAGSAALAIASGPIIGGLLVQYVNWQSIFYVNLGIGALAVAGALLFVAESRDRRTQGLDFTGATLLAGALFCLVWALIQTDTHAWGSAYTLGFLAGAGMLAALWAGRLATARRPLVPASVLRVASLDAGAVAVIAVAFAMFGFLFYVMLYLQRVQGYSPVAAGLRILPLTGLVGLSAPLGGALGGRIPLRLQVSGGLLLITGGMFGLTRLTPGSSFDILWPWFALTGLGTGLTLTGATRAILGSAPVEHAGIAAGIQQTSIQIGAALGTAILGTVVTARVGGVLPGDLLARHVPPALASKLAAAKAAIAGGIVPAGHGVPSALARAVTAASYQAVTEGMHIAFIVAGLLAAGASVIALMFIQAPNPAADQPVAAL